MAKYGLENLSPEFRDKVKDIDQDLIGTGLMEAGMKLSMSAKTEDQLQVQYLKTIIEQNWLMIRLLDDLKNK